MEYPGINDSNESKSGKSIRSIDDIDERDLKVAYQATDPVFYIEGLE